MFKYSKADLASKAKEHGFVRDTLEKVFRLADILDHLNANPLTKNTLALKGGTAINLTVFNLPRLSVDIDLDYSENCSREEMLLKRERITSDIKTHMTTQGYFLSEKSKYRHSLDSFIFVYQNLGGMNDNIKIEINYSLRCHIFELTHAPVLTGLFSSEKSVLSVAPMEIFAAKINALLSRAAARDLYDTYNMIILGLFNKTEYDLLRKSVVFYTAVSQESISDEYDFNHIESITRQKIKTDLLPVITRGELVPLDDMKQTVKAFLSELLQLTDDEKSFLVAFSQKEYSPELLFDDKDILERISNHPMVQWKMQEH